MEMILSRRFESVRYALKPDFNDFVASIATGLLDKDDLHNDFTTKNTELKTIILVGLLNCYLLEVI